MRTWRITTVAAVAVVMCALVALAVQGQDRPTERQPSYKVVSWPVNTADRPYREDVERLLNEMAAQGWRFHGDLASQGSRMLVFERASSR